MKVKDLMTMKVITIKKETLITDCIKEMEKHDLGFLVIISDERKILGVITDRDILIRLFNKKFFTDGITEKTVEDVMTYTAITVNKELDIEEAIKVFSDYQLNRIPVVNDKDELVGVITLKDLAICKLTTKFVSDIYREISIPNPQTEKPLKYLHVDDFRL